jgi:hypothetical protein
MRWLTDIENAGKGIMKPRPEVAIRVQRIIWGALIMGQLGFMGVVGFIILNPGPAAGAVRIPDDSLKMLLMLNAGMLVTIVPTMFLVRWWMFSRARADGVIPVEVYAKGNIMFWAGCEGCSFFGLIIALMHGDFWPSIVIVAVAMGLQAAAFPRSSHVKAAEGTFKIE